MLGHSPMATGHYLGSKPPLGAQNSGRGNTHIGAPGKATAQILHPKRKKNLMNFLLFKIYFYLRDCGKARKRGRILKQTPR